MAKTKYNKTIVDKIITNIEQYGTDKTACELVGIHKDTFYEWKKRYSDFADRINAAKEHFRTSNLNSEMGVISLAAAKKILTEGKTITITTKIKKGAKTIKRRNPQTGKMVVAEIHEEEPTETLQIKHLPPPESVLNLYCPMNLAAAQELLERHGYVVLDPSQAAQQEESKPGVTDETYHKITGNVLGVNTKMKTIEVDAQESTDSPNSSAQEKNPGSDEEIQ